MRTVTYQIGLQNRIGDLCDLQKHTCNMTVQPSEHIWMRGIVSYSNYNVF